MKRFLIVGVLAVIAGLAVGIVLINIGGTSGTPEQNQEKPSVQQNELVGKQLPSINLMDQNETPFGVEGLRGKNVVLFFNEGLMCYPACWNQIAAFGADERFNSADTVALSVVIDSPKDWERAIAKMPELAKATMLFDRGAQASRMLGVVSMASSMHPGQYPGHTYILVDKQGVIRDIIDDPNMAIQNDSIFEKISKY